MKDPRKPTRRRRFLESQKLHARKAGQSVRMLRPQRIGKDQAQGHHH
ncbi:MAG: hypothetical protein ABFR89_01130 [Actinomycetota bacterium]